MTKLLLIFLCIIFGNGMATDLGERTKYFASVGVFKPKNLVLEKGEPISLPWDGSDFRPITITVLNVSGCKGTIDKTTFYRLPYLRDIDFSDCQIDHLYPDAFSTLTRLESVAFTDSIVKFVRSPDVGYVITPPLPNFRLLYFEKSIVAGLNRNSLHDFSLLNELSIENCKVNDISSDTFDDLQNVTKFLIKSTQIENFDLGQILKLKTITYLALYNLVTTNQTDYSIFKDLPNLDTILFDTTSYENLNFDAFPSLKNVQVGLGLGRTQDREKLISNLFDKIMDRVNALEAEGIKKLLIRIEYTVSLGDFSNN